jgi:hypothetical protein
VSFPADNARQTNEETGDKETGDGEVHPSALDCPSGRALTVSDVGALSDLDNIAVRIADVAAYLAVLGDRLRDELGSSTFP